MKERIGFIGVGLMGHGMAKNIVEKGHALTVIAHTRREAVEDLKQRGAQEASDLAMLVNASDVVVLCVTGAPQVEATIAAMRPHLRAGMMIMDASTSKPELTRQLAQALKQLGVDYIDIPLIRGPVQAWEGKLGVMIGGDDAQIARAKPIIDTFAVKLVHCGPVGSAHTVKLINNFVAIGYLSVWAEAYTTAFQSGANAKALWEIMTGGGLDCLNFQGFSKATIEGDKATHKFTIDNIKKDIGYYVELARDSGNLGLISDAVQNFAELAVNRGWGDKYQACLFDASAELNGLKLK